jgi:hypothetical protein
LVGFLVVVNKGFDEFGDKEDFWCLLKMVNVGGCGIFVNCINLCT